MCYNVLLFIIRKSVQATYSILLCLFIRCKVADEVC
jgi:hypothetical protein